MNLNIFCQILIGYRIYPVLVLMFCMAHIDGFGQQASGEGYIREVLYRLFKGMALGDSAMVHATFEEGATMVSVFRDKVNNVSVLDRASSIDQFLKVIGSPHPAPYYEEIWNTKIFVDDDLAQVWCDYALYVGNKFHHCGVDAIQLHKSGEGWKIFHLADTRRTAGCNIPEEIQNKHK
jgi:hypothetical protein